MVNKINIKPFRDSAVTMLNEVPIIQFNYEGDSEVKLGYIPNEVEPPFTDFNKTKFEQGNCIAMLIKAVQELSCKIDKLEKENEIRRDY